MDRDRDNSEPPCGRRRSRSIFPPSLAGAGAMTWFSSFLVAILTGLLGMLVSGFVANLAVGWYRMSSFEGASGYFVVAMALLGLAAGGLIGFGAARMVSATAHSAFGQALGGAAAIIVILGGSVAGVARLLADVPPEIDGRELLLAVEVAWPPDDPAGPAARSGQGYLRLSSATAGRTVRASTKGPLFLDLARHEGGRWIAPGVVPIFTARGTPIIDAGIGDHDLGGLIINLPGRPGTADREWTDWLPMPRPGAAPLPPGFRYRYRVILDSEPARVDTVGPFEIETVATAFYEATDSDGLAAMSQFRISYRGTPLPDFANAGGVSLVGEPPAALLVQRTGPSDSECHLLRETDDALAVEGLAPCAAPIEGQFLTADPARHGVRPGETPVPGWIDRDTFRAPGLYLMRHGVLDTRSLSFGTFTEPSGPWRINGLPAATLSPDTRSFVWFSHDGSDDQPILGVTDRVADETYTVPVNRDRMRYRDYHEIGPEWVAHHFEWVRGPDGVERLRARGSFVPLPHRGTLTSGRPGDYLSYALRPAGAALREAVVGLLVSGLGAERMPDEVDGYYRVVRLEGKILRITTSGPDRYVAIGMDSGASDPELMARVAAFLDAEMARGTYDSLFVADP